MAAKWTADTLMIRGEEIEVRRGKMLHSQLRFYVDNPRIYSVVRVGGDEPEQEDIERQLLEMNDVKELIQDIKANQGLIEALVVRDGTFEVLEGNRRLAAIRWLAEIEPIKWGYVPVVLLPKNLSESQVFALLGQYHIKGKKEWAPYEQAGFVYRRNKEHGIPVPKLGEELGVSARRVKQLVDAYMFMIASNDPDQRHWSYYEEYIKSNKIKTLRSKYEGFDEEVVAQIKSGVIDRAADIRDKLPILVSAPAKVVKKFVSRELSLDEAVERIEEAGNTDKIYKRLHNLRTWLSDPDTKKHIRNAEGELKNKVKYEIGKIDSSVRMLLKALK